MECCSWCTVSHIRLLLRCQPRPPSPTSRPSRGAARRRSHAAPRDGDSGESREAALRTQLNEQLKRVCVRLYCETIADRSEDRFPRLRVSGNFVYYGFNVVVERPDGNAHKAHAVKCGGHGQSGVGHAARHASRSVSENRSTIMGHADAAPTATPAAARDSPTGCVRNGPTGALCGVFWVCLLLGS